MMLNQRWLQRVYQVHRFLHIVSQSWPLKNVIHIFSETVNYIYESNKTERTFRRSLIKMKQFYSAFHPEHRIKEDNAQITAILSGISNLQVLCWVWFINFDWHMHMPGRIRMGKDKNACKYVKTSIYAGIQAK